MQKQANNTVVENRRAASPLPLQRMGDSDHMVTLFFFIFIKITMFFACYVIPSLWERDRVRPPLVCRRLEVQSRCLFKVEQEVHVVHRLSARTLQQVVDA